MKRVTCFIVLAVFATFLSSAPLFAHHSFDAEFDVYQPVSFDATITKIEWINPHVQIHVDAMVDGKVVPWRIASWDPYLLRNAGLMRSRFVVGQKVNIAAYSAKDGSKVAYLRHIKFPDKQEFDLWIGGANGSTQQQK
jgi:hypothetical protein